MIGCAIGLAAWIAGCATAPLPECERWEYSVIEDRNGDKWMLLDDENATKLATMMYGLAYGKCRPPTTDKGS